MIEVFSDRDGPGAHDRFQGWRERNYEHGLFLNVRSPATAMLHWAACPHLKGSDWGPEEPAGSLTRHPKVCSANREELESWARSEGVRNLSRCRDCERLAAF